MSSNIICFLSIYCHDSFSVFLRNSFPTSEGVELLDDNYIRSGNSRYACGALNSELQSKIFARLFAHYDKNHCSSIDVPNEHKQEFEIMIELARQTLDNRIGEIIIKLLEDSLPGGVTDYFCQDVLDSLRPNNSLGFEAFRKIKELLKKSFTIDELEFYSKSSPIADNLWKDRVREQLNYENGLQFLSSKAILFLYDDQRIKVDTLVSCFIERFSSPAKPSWSDLKPLITRLLKDDDNQGDYDELLRLLENGGGILDIVIARSPDLLNPFIPFLKQQEVQLVNMLPIEVNWLLSKGVINPSSAFDYYVNKTIVRWEDITVLISCLLNDVTQYDNLWKLLEHFNSQWLSLRLESFIEQDWSFFLRYLKAEHKIELGLQPPKVVNRLQELGIIDLNDAALYYIGKPNVKWTDISSLASALLKDKVQYDNLWKLLEHFNSQWLSLRLESFNEQDWLAFLRFLKDEQRIDIDNQPPHVVNRLQELGIIDLNDAVLYYSRKPNIKWDDIRLLVSSLLKDKTQYDNLWNVLSHFDSQWLSSILDYINEKDWFDFLIYLKDEQRIDIDNQTPQVVNRLSDIQVIDSNCAIDYYLSQQFVSWADIRSLVSGLLNDNTKYDKLWQLLMHFDSRWLSSILKSIKMDSEWLAFLRYLLGNNRIILEEQSPELVGFLRMNDLITTPSAVKFFNEAANNKNVGNIYWSDISVIISAYLEDGELYNNLTLLLNKCQGGYSKLFEYYSYSAIIQYLIYIKNSVSNIIECWINLDNRKRELLLQTVVDNLSDFRSIQALLTKYFEVYEQAVSSELYCYLFTKNYFFGFIMSAFKKIVSNMNREGVDNVMKKAVDNKAWSIAKDIINNTNASN